VGVPDFQSFLRPFLQEASDGKDHRFPEMLERLAAHFGADERDLAEMVPSGTQSRFENRVRWATFYLRRAGFITNTAHGQFRITPLGMQALAKYPVRLDGRTVKSYWPATTPEGTASTSDGIEVEPAQQTPLELLEASYAELRRSLRDELLERIKACPPPFFERLVVDLLVAMGYGGSRADAGQAVGRSGDGGIDGIIKEDKLGLDAIYVQAKRWDGTVGRPVVQGFAGSLDGVRAKKGVLITTSQFSEDAKAYVERIEKKIVLIDGPRLAELMIDHDVGVTLVSSYVAKRIDSDYFDGAG